MFNNKKMDGRKDKNSIEILENFRGLIIKKAKLASVKAIGTSAHINASKADIGKKVLVIVLE